MPNVDFAPIQRVYLDSVVNELGMLTLGVGELARLLGTNRDLVKTWAYHFSEYLSPGANPGSGIPRRFTPDDVPVLAYILMYWEDDPDLESIQIGLNREDHLEEPFWDVRAQLLPFFQEPPEDLDETWRWGALMGGMSVRPPDPLLLAESYKQAGDLLAAAALQRDEVQELIDPVLYMYRHATELYLKSALPPGPRDHDLATRLRHLRELIRREFNAEVPEWFERAVLEFHDFDPDSTTFRYPDSQFHSRRTGDPGEFWVDLRHVKQIMAWMGESFHRIRRAQIDRGRIRR